MTNSQLSPPGRGLVSVGFMLRFDEWSHGFRCRQRTAARLQGWCRTLQVCPQCWLLHLPACPFGHQWSGVQGLWSGFLSLQAEGRYLKKGDYWIGLVEFWFVSSRGMSGVHQKFMMGWEWCFFFFFRWFSDLIVSSDYLLIKRVLILFIFLCRFHWCVEVFNIGMSNPPQSHGWKSPDFSSQARLKKISEYLNCFCRETCN